MSYKSEGRWFDPSWCQWLRCCATNRKDASSIPGGVSGFFIDIKSFRCCSTVVKVMSYKSEGRWFDPSWCHWLRRCTTNRKDASSIPSGVIGIFIDIKTFRCGSTVFKVLCYKSEGRGLDSRWCHWNFSLT